MSFEFQICSIEHMKHFMNFRDLFLALKTNVVSYKSADNVILREETVSFRGRAFILTRPFKQDNIMLEVLFMVENRTTSQLTSC